jgi:hypothetical protein
MEDVRNTLQKDIARVREIFDLCKRPGSTGNFGTAMIEQSLSAADVALMNDDVTAMFVACKDLREIIDWSLGY